MGRTAASPTPHTPWCMTSGCRRLQVRVSMPMPGSRPDPGPIKPDPDRAAPRLAWGAPAAGPAGGAGGAAADAESPIATGAALQGLYGGSLAENLAAVEETLRAEGYLLADLSLGGGGGGSSAAPAGPPAWHASGACPVALLPSSWGLPAGSAG